MTDKRQPTVTPRLQKMIEAQDAVGVLRFVSSRSFPNRTAPDLFTSDANAVLVFALRSQNQDLLEKWFSKTTTEIFSNLVGSDVQLRKEFWRQAVRPLLDQPDALVLYRELRARFPGQSNLPLATLTEIQQRFPRFGLEDVLRASALDFEHTANQLRPPAEFGYTDYHPFPDFLGKFVSHLLETPRDQRLKDFLSHLSPGLVSELTVDLFKISRSTIASVNVPIFMAVGPPMPAALLAQLQQAPNPPAAPQGGSHQSPADLYALACQTMLLHTDIKLFCCDFFKWFDGRGPNNKDLLARLMRVLNMADPVLNENDLLLVHKTAAPYLDYFGNTDPLPSRLTAVLSKRDIAQHVVPDMELSRPTLKAKM